MNEMQLIFLVYSTVIVVGSFVAFLCELKGIKDGLVYYMIGYLSQTVFIIFLLERYGLNI